MKLELIYLNGQEMSINNSSQKKKKEKKMLDFKYISVFKKCCILITNRENIVYEFVGIDMKFSFCKFPRKKRNTSFQMRRLKIR